MRFFDAERSSKKDLENFQEMRRPNLKTSSNITNFLQWQAIMHIASLVILNRVRSQLSHAITHSQNSVIKQLQSIEGRIAFLGNSPEIKTRCSLIKTLFQGTCAQIYSQIHRPNRANPIITTLEGDKQKIEAFKLKLQSEPKADCKTDFEALSAEDRRRLCWALWVKEKCPQEDGYGEKLIRQDYSVLLSSDPLIFLKGESLLDQLNSLIDQKIAYEKQKQVIQTLDFIRSYLYNHSVDMGYLLHEIGSLPIELQWKMYHILYPTAEQQQSAPCFPHDFWQLVNLRGPHLDQLLDEEKKVVKNLQLSGELEEFERMTVLYSTSTEHQRAAHLHWISPKVRDWILEIASHENGTADPVYLYEHRGAHIQGNETTFCVYAPNAKSVTLVLTAYGYEEHKLKMEKSEGTWNISTDKAPVGRSYRYLIEDAQGNCTYRTDPFSFSTVDCGGWAESKVSAVDQYTWSDSDWMQSRQTGNGLDRPWSVYELSAEFWMKEEGRPVSFKKLADELVAYCKYMHYTHVELYGLLDNLGNRPGDVDWGYKVHNYFAPNQRMGTIDDVQYLVDKLHQNHIGVILDWIPAHYRHLPKESTLHEFDGTDLFSAGPAEEWGTMFFDFSKDETKRLLKASVLYWLREVHVDAIRFDAISHIVKRFGKDLPPQGIENPEGIAFLKDLNRSIAGLFPDVLKIAEDPNHFPQLTTPIDQGGLGFDLKWGIHEGQKMRWFLQTPPQHRAFHHYDKFMQHMYHFSEGEKSMITHSHDDMANRHLQENFPPQHDQTLYAIDTFSKLKKKFGDMRNFFAWQILSSNHGYLIHMNDDIGGTRSWDSAIWSKEGSVQRYLLDPTYENSAYHRGLQTWVSDLNALYAECPAFWKNKDHNFRLCSDHPTNNVIAYERSDADGQGVIVIHNFSDKGFEKYDISLGQNAKVEHIKDLKTLLNSDDLKYGGKGKYPIEEVDIHRHSHEPYITVALAPLSTIVLKKVL